MGSTFVFDCIATNYPGRDKVLNSWSSGYSGALVSFPDSAVVHADDNELVALSRGLAEEGVRLK
jgi:hypothetical protein